MISVGEKIGNIFMQGEAELGQRNGKTLTWRRGTEGEREREYGKKM
jgi:hypothetical protein